MKKRLPSSEAQALSGKKQTETASEAAHAGLLAQDAKLDPAETNPMTNMTPDTAMTLAESYCAAVPATWAALI